MTVAPDEWRSMIAADLPDVERIGTSVHPNHPEHEDICAERLRLFPAGCRVLDGPAGLGGYVLSHPWRLGAPPGLDTRLGMLPAVPDTFYIHDLALLPAMRGVGQGRVVLATLAMLAVRHALPSMSLIAVGASHTFWMRHGFMPAPLSVADLGSYGPGATYLVRHLTV